MTGRVAYLLAAAVSAATVLFASAASAGCASCGCSKRGLIHVLEAAASCGYGYGYGYGYGRHHYGHGYAHAYRSGPVYVVNQGPTYSLPHPPLAPIVSYGYPRSYPYLHGHYGQRHYGYRYVRPPHYGYRSYDLPRRPAMYRHHYRHRMMHRMHPTVQPRMHRMMHRPYGYRMARPHARHMVRPYRYRAHMMPGHHLRARPYLGPPRGYRANYGVRYGRPAGPRAGAPVPHPRGAHGAGPMHEGVKRGP